MAAPKDLVPTWAISTWIYGDYPGDATDQINGIFNQATWLSDVQTAITFYNTNQKNSSCQFNMVYPYACDLELPWSNWTSGTNSGWNDPTQYGFYLYNDALPLTVTTLSGISGCQTAIIVDGRIDNGYLQGFNEFITPANAQALANLIVYGTSTATTATTNGVGYYAPGGASTPIINGIQLDLEPFDGTNPNQQAFYTEIGSLLQKTGQFYSIYTFPKAMTAETATLLNGSNNGYMIISLYDVVDMKDGIPAACSADYNNVSGVCDTSTAPPPVTASGDATTAIYDTSVPHSAAGYYNAVLLTVQQTIARAATTGIKYKFGIPMTSSVHEFENWGQYVCNFDSTSKGKPINGFCRMFNGLPKNVNSGTPSQLEYVQQAIKAIQDGITSMGSTYTDYADLFRGIDFYSFGYRTIWSPQNPVTDDVSGYFFYGNTPVSVTDGTSLNPPYVYTTPSAPTYGYLADGKTPDPNTVLGWLATTCFDPRPGICK